MPVDVMVRSWAASPSTSSSRTPWIVANLAQDMLHPIPIRRTASDFGEVDPLSRTKWQECQNSFSHPHLKGRESS